MHSSVKVGSSESSLIAEFVAAATSTGTRVLFATSAELRELLASSGIGSGGHDPGISCDLSVILDFNTGHELAARPTAWISRARVGIASTGTLLVAERLAEDRLGALLCTRHTLVLPSSCIVATHAEAAEWLRSFVTSGLSYVTLISGPSRTSDIEKVLTLGAHGPAELEVVLVDGWDPSDD